jgi:hypothetical protein
MIRYSITFVLLSCFLWVGYTLVGCSDFEHKQKDEYFIKVGSRTITVAEFNKAFEIAKNAYSNNRIRKTDIAREARLRLIQQMTEEMILLQRAEELGITVTDSQVEKALKDIKKDYPDNVFQETLLEYAVPYQSFTEGLKTRLIMEKVITQNILRNTSRMMTRYLIKSTSRTRIHHLVGKRSQRNQRISTTKSLLKYCAKKSWKKHMHRG